MAKAKVPTDQELNLCFARAHTHGLLRRFLYTAIQPCRIGSTLHAVRDHGWVSSRTITTFEDAMIFVHDMERCLDALPSLDRDILTRVVIQEHTHEDAAVLLGMSTRALSYKLPAAMDRLTAKLIEAELLLVPQLT
jgi:DNA-directed RNA polymerase specialized sigma24 family protein